MTVSLESGCEALDKLGEVDERNDEVEEDDGVGKLNLSISWFHQDCTSGSESSR